MSIFVSQISTVGLTKSVYYFICGLLFPIWDCKSLITHLKEMKPPINKKQTKKFRKNSKENKSFLLII